jgi:hypothetical protein
MTRSVSQHDRDPSPFGWRSFYDERRGIGFAIAVEIPLYDTRVLVLVGNRFQTAILPDLAGKRLAETIGRFGRAPILLRLCSSRRLVVSGRR